MACDNPIEINELNYGNKFDFKEIDVLCNN